MTHCVACDKNLSDFESTRKIEHDNGSVEYLDLCNGCFKVSGLTVGYNIIERNDLSHEDDISNDEWEDEPETDDLVNFN